MVDVRHVDNNQIKLFYTMFTAGGVRTPRYTALLYPTPNRVDEAIFCLPQ